MADKIRTYRAENGQRNKELLICLNGKPAPNERAEACVLDRGVMPGVVFGKESG
ncbi:hypothetical protein KUV26_12075 [Leisingera daeponensis]|uniref:Uncharacterized protein n=1 Tax=Leisingera daeponensis TaxID=405746 RepID=A0ABS7NG40_9RHOB|nr:hypothetical protein [Leisingera daeponensis]MBY6056406.1 hypothetical protein [Leisingera daeponensis]MBY6140175.1 hypothetical protein [Leisingera daeponensis]